jgi:hypothetical protein
VSRKPELTKINTIMAERENERNNPSQQQQPGYQQANSNRDREGEQNSYDNRNVTNSDRDLGSTNAANQQRNEHPNMGSQREGQQQNDPQRSEENGNGQKIIPEVPEREEEHGRQTPRAEDGNNPNAPQL